MRLPNFLPMPALPLTRLRDLLRFAVRRLNEEHLPQVAGSLTFTTVLALVPMLTIALAIFTAFPLFNTFRASLDAYFIQNLMPKVVGDTVLGYLNQFAAKSMRLSAFGGALLLGTALVMMFTIERVFNQIWRVRTARPLAQRILVYWAIVTLGPLLIGVSITVTSFLFTATNGVVRHVPFADLFYTLLSVLLTTGAFTLLYLTVPNRRVDWSDAACGGLVAGIAFEIAKRLFAIYVTRFPTYTVVYGAVAAVPIFLLWIYTFWMITLAGALVAAALPVVRHERWWHVATPGSDFVDAMLVLRVLYDARCAASSAVDAAAIRERTRLGFDESEILLQRMLDAGWVARLRGDAPTRLSRLGWDGKHARAMDRWTLLANPAELKLADVYRLFVFAAHEHTLLGKNVETVVEAGLQQPIGEWFATDLAIRMKPGRSPFASTSPSRQ